MFGKLIGFVSGVVAALMWNQLMWFGGTESPQLFPEFIIAKWSQPFPVFVVAMIMVVLSIAVVIASIREHHRVLFVLFVIAFFPIGISIFTAEHWIRWVAVANLGFLLASLLMWRSTGTSA